MRLDACRPHGPRRWPAALNQVNSPLHWQVWDRCLRSHPDERFRRYIVDGIRFGFRVGFNYNQSTPNNMLSTREQPGVIRDYLAKECNEG